MPGDSEYKNSTIRFLAPPPEDALPVSTQDLTRRSKPVISLQQLANWIHREPRPTQEEELEQLRSELPRRWLAELRRVIQEELLNEPTT